MYHWFHRNAMKSTTNKSIKRCLSYPPQPQGIQLCDEFKKARLQTLELLTDPSSDPEDVDKQLKHYLSLLLGLVFDPRLNPNSGPTDSSELRTYIKFKWTDSLLGSIQTAKKDSVFELISILIQYSIWLSKHCSHLAAEPDITTEECFKCLRKAAGVLTLVQSQWSDRLRDKSVSEASDLDPRVLSAYIQQFTGEAQEMTIARAIELTSLPLNSPSLLSALTNETSKVFLSAASAIKEIDPSKVSKWMTYFQLKSAFYESYAFCFLGESLFRQGKCGEGIRALEESEKFYETSAKLFKDYKKMKSPAGVDSPLIDEHLFFRRLQTQIKRTQNKCSHNNLFIFHQKVPKDCPPLELKATQGLVEPEVYKLPEINEWWTQIGYTSFDVGEDISIILLPFLLIPIGIGLYILPNYI